MTNKEHRNTALLVGLVAAAAAGWSLFRRHEVAAFVGGGGALLLVMVGLFAPGPAAAFHRAWMRLAQALGYVNSRILMTVAFYGLITPVGLVMRLIGRDELEVRSGREAETYWKTRTLVRTKESFEKAF